MTRADLDAALALVERERSSFADPDGLTQYLSAQHAQLAARETALASPPADGETEVISDVAPKRKPSKAKVENLSPQLAAIPAARRTVYRKAGFDDAQMLAIAAFDVNPREVLKLMQAPPVPRALSWRPRFAAPPENTPAQIIAALVEGLTLDDLGAYHQAWVPVSQAGAVKASGLDPDQALRRIATGCTLDQAITFQKAGFDEDDVYAVVRDELPFDVALKAKQRGMPLYHLVDALEIEGNTPAEVLALWQKCPHALLDGSLDEAREHTAGDLKKLFDGKVIDFSRSNREIDEELREYRALGASVDDIVRVVAGGGDADGLRWALDAGLSVDDYLKLARAKVDTEMFRLVSGDVTADQVIAFAATGQDDEFFSLAIGRFGFTAEQAMVLARADLEPYDVNQRYLERGLSREQAIRVIAAGG
ncbi:MAG: hypothetical protein IPJ65_37660 [Archangiaceae bacterium]|nr:hypothetical protein [Archangiaceae bacterium]